jgi:hypothetical protein
MIWDNSQVFLNWTQKEGDRGKDRKIPEEIIAEHFPNRMNTVYSQTQEAQF